MAEPDDRYDEVLGLAAGELERLLRRLSQLTPRAWSTRREPVVSLLRQLAAIDAAVEQTPTTDVPDLPDHALADATAVIGGDVLDVLSATRDPAALDRLLRELRVAWTGTR